MREKICGVYKIENTINGNIYVGVSIDCDYRKKSHIRLLNNNKHTNSHLQRAWNKYGEKSFIFSIIEKCNKEDLPQREIYWISYYDSCNNGYNQTYGGDGTANIKFPKERGEKISKALKGRKHPDKAGKNATNARKIICLDTGNIYDCIEYAAKQIGIVGSAIVASCKNHIAISKNKHVFAYWDDYLNMSNNEIDEIIMYAQEKYMYKYYKKSKPIICLNTKENFLNGVSASKKYKAEYSYLMKCCKGMVSSCGKDSSGNGLAWMFLEEYNNVSEDVVKSRIENAITKSKHNIPIPVHCITTNEIFKSCAAATRKYNLYQGTFKKHLDSDGIVGVHPITNEPLVWEKMN